MAELPFHVCLLPVAFLCLLQYTRFTTNPKVSTGSVWLSRQRMLLLYLPAAALAQHPTVIVDC
jgi:hypothetical protein